jgi:hypothetical protein
MCILHWLVVLKNTKKILNCKAKPTNLTFTCSKGPNQQTKKTSMKSFKDFTLLTTPNYKKLNHMKPLCQKREIYSAIVCLNTLLTIIKTKKPLNPLPKNCSNSGRIPMKEKSMKFSGMKKLLKKTLRFS